MNAGDDKYYMVYYSMTVQRRTSLVLLKLLSIMYFSLPLLNAVSLKPFYFSHGPLGPISDHTSTFIISPGSHTQMCSGLGPYRKR